MKKVFEPVTKDITDSSKQISLALEGLKNKLIEVLELLELIKSRIPRSTISSRNLELLDLIHSRIPKTPRK